MLAEKQAYHGRTIRLLQEARVPRRIPLLPAGETFGKRIARLRKAAGYTQRELAVELGISNRMVAYYEGETDYPPAAILPTLARVLGVSADELLGLKPVKTKPRTQDNRLWRRFRQVEKLPSIDRRQIVQLIDTFLDRADLREKRA